MYSQRPSINSFIWNILRYNGYLAETAVYITRLNYMTYIFYQRIIVVALKDMNYSALKT